jgi:hypothetical protein
MAKEEHQERRQHKRYIVTGLRIRFIEKRLFGLLSKSASQEYLCLDISEDGLQFATQDKFNPQDDILIDITTPNTKKNPIRVNAKVVWFDSSLGRVGIQFIHIDEKDRAVLKTLIEKSGTDKSQITPYIQAKIMKEDSMFLRIKK